MASLFHYKIELLIRIIHRQGISQIKTINMVEIAVFLNERKLKTESQFCIIKIKWKKSERRRCYV